MNNKEIVKHSIINKAKDKILLIYGISIFFMFCINLLFFLLKKDIKDLGFLKFTFILFITNFVLYLIYTKFINKSKIKYDIKNEIFINILLIFINFNIFYYKNDLLLFFNIIIIIFSVIFCDKNLIQITLYKVVFINLLYFIIKYINSLLSFETLTLFFIVSCFTIFSYFISYVLLDLLFEQLDYILTINKRQTILSNNLNKAVKDLKIEPMTGLFNKRAMYETIETKINNFKYFNRDSHLVIIDLDFFKRVNDTYGHTVGDEVLISLADLLKSKIKHKANAFRFGGEEFVIIFDKQTTNEVYNIVENIRITFNRKVFKSLNNERLSFSAGISKLKLSFNAEQWLESADTALYQAKNNGRNQTIIQE